jgi:hypothetical protein
MPVTTPTTRPVAPSEANSGPVIDRAPSYTKSASRLTVPNVATNRHALNAGVVDAARTGQMVNALPTRLV